MLWKRIAVPVICVLLIVAMIGGLIPARPSSAWEGDTWSGRTRFSILRSKLRRLLPARLLTGDSVEVVSLLPEPEVTELQTGQQYTIVPTVDYNRSTAKLALT